MKIVYGKDHRDHAPRFGLSASGRIAYPEVPQRAQAILEHLQSLGRHEIMEPAGYSPDLLADVHAPGYLKFLERGYGDWTASGEPEEGIIPDVFPVRSGGRPGRSPANQAGWYGFDIFTPIVKGTYRAAILAARSALTAADCILAGERSAYALTRPPGHHAGSDFFGGYCYLNHAALAASHLQSGAERPLVAILDIDAHHGNGTQEIFYDSDEVLFVSLHADPNEDYPYYSGYPEETGRGAGEGYTLNLPLPVGSEEAAFREAWKRALARISRFAPRYLVVSLGVDAVAGDPIGNLALPPDAFGRLGQNVGQLALPTVVVQEGGYDHDLIGPCVALFLEELG